MFDVARSLWRGYRWIATNGPLAGGLVWVSVDVPSPALPGQSVEALSWGVGAVAAAVVGAVVWRRYRRRATFGSASFAGRRDLRRKGLRGRRGLIVGKHGGRYMRFRGDGHLLTFAPTRSGKGVGCVIPNLLTHPGSAVVTDIKGENLAVTGRRRARMTGGAVHALAPFDESTESACFNPLDFIRRGEDGDVDDAALMADLVVVPEGPSDSFFESEATNLVTGLLLYVVYHMPAERRTMQEVWSVLMRDEAGFDEVLQDMRVSEHKTIARIGAGFAQKADRERSAVISTAQTHLQIWRSDRLASVTCRSDFRLEDLKRERMSLYIVIPPELVGTYRSFLRLMIGLGVSAMTRVPQRPRENVVFFLDEVASLGRMKPLEEGVSYLAGYGVSLWFFFQDLGQLEETYRKWRSIVANCTVRQGFNVSDVQTAQELSSMLGETTVDTRSQGRAAGSRIALWPRSVSSTRSDARRALMTPEEVMRLSEEEQLIFLQGCRPIRARKVRYHREPRLRRAAA